MLDAAGYTPRLKTAYQDTFRAAMKEEFGYKNDMQIPRLEKVVINIGCGAEAVRDSKKAKSAIEDLTKIAGQQAVVHQGEEIASPPSGSARRHDHRRQGHAARRSDV